MEEGLNDEEVRLKMLLKESPIRLVMGERTFLESLEYKIMEEDEKASQSCQLTMKVWYQLTASLCFQSIRTSVR